MGTIRTAPTARREPFATDTPVQRSKLAAFQHAWFQIVAAQLGCAGTAKWDTYEATYDSTPQSFYTLGGPVQNTWDSYPTYDLLQLFTTTTEPGWQAASVPGLEPWAAVAEFREGTGIWRSSASTHAGR